MKTILFARVSSKEQEEMGYSLPAQEKLLEDYALNKELKITKRFSISESAGGRYQRKTFNEMLDYSRKKDVKIIICEKVDRLTRNLKDAVSINEWVNENQERQVHFVKENFLLTQNSKSHEKFIWSIKASVSQYYIDNLSEETKKGMIQKAENGWYPGSHKRGYLLVNSLESKKSIWILDKSQDSEAPFIKRAFELYANTDWSLKKLIEEIFKEGWRTKTGEPIPKSTLSTILNDPFYCGKFRWREKLYDGKQEALISEELFEIVQRKLLKRHTPLYRHHNHLFKGMIRCGECGCSITSELQKGHVYYRCTHYKPCGQKKYLREEEVEKQILDSFDEITITDKETLELVAEGLRGSHAEEMAYHNQVLNTLNKRYQTLQNRLDTLYIDKLDKRITAERYEELEAKFRQEQEEIREELARYENTNINYFELGANLIELSSRAKEIYLKRTQPEDKRRLLNLLFLNLTLKDGFVRKIYTKPFQIVSERVKTSNVGG